MARRRRLGVDARREWAAEIELAKTFYKTKIKDSSKYSRAARSNLEHWKNEAWDYDMVTTNLVYANQQSILPRVLMRQPKVIVKPASRLTRAFMREGQADPLARLVAAASVQQIVNWRWREFDFTKQVRRAVRDDHDRGMGIIRHGFMGIGDKSRTERNKSLEFVNHKHLREGWPYAVHQSLDDSIWDQRARDLDERRWCGSRSLWRVDDLKAYFGLRNDPPVTEMLGADMFSSDSTERRDFERAHGDFIAYTAVFEIWDRRANEIVYWIDGQDEDLCVEDWPIEFEGLPDSVIMTNEPNERIEPVPEPAMYWELQQDLNRMLSLILIYAKRGVPLIGVDANQLADGEEEKITDAEILEVIRTKGNPNEALALMNLTPVPQTLLLAVNMVQEFIRLVGGVGKMEQGTRENVESAQEAAQIAQGSDIRSSMRAEAVRRFCAEVVRKDFQVFQQTVQEDQILDIVASGMPPQLVKITREQMMLEFDFDIQVGSSEPLNEKNEQTKALALVAALQADPQVYAQANPRWLAELLVTAFGYDTSEALASAQAAQQQRTVDGVMGMMGGGGGGGATKSLGAGLDAIKSAPDNRDAAAQ